MRPNSDSVRARLTIVAAVFVVSACVINKSGDAPKSDAQQDEDTAGVADDSATDGAGATAKTAELPPAPVGPPKNLMAAGTTAKATVTSKGAANSPASVRAKHPAPAPAPARTAKASTRVVRYVAADILNVRSSPHASAPVIAKLARGSMFTVSLLGEWAKLGENEYVLVKYLARARPEPKLGQNVHRHGRVASRR